jgi:hypothetical protein
MLDTGSGVSSCSSRLTDALLAIHVRSKRFTRNGSQTDVLPDVHVNQLLSTLYLPEWHIGAIKFYTLRLSAQGEEEVLTIV